MRELITTFDMRGAAAEAGRAGKRVALVPTMGYLHEGHLALVREARRRGDLVVMSVFVNPLQFAPGEDFESYPRDPARDRALAESAGVDVLFSPVAEEMYGEPPQVTVAPGPVGSILEGAVRPSHFAGVLTVVCKLFAIVQPRLAVFGRKDAQQAALVLPRALAAGALAFQGGERRAGQVVAAAYRVLGPAEAAGDVTTEYINVVDAGTFLPNHAAQSTSYLVAAIRVGKKRLIDNVVLGEGLDADPRLSADARAGG